MGVMRKIVRQRLRLAGIPRIFLKDIMRKSYLRVVVTKRKRKGN